MSDITDAMRADLGRKCAQDVSDALRRTALLLDTPQDRFLIALCATATAAGAAVGYASQLAPAGTPEQEVDLFWRILRPMVLSVATGNRADMRELMRKAPKGDGTLRGRRHPR